ncbi:hypothetical protein O4H52_14970 [Sphingomonadaceae bacterium G21617-S1]|jgi:hypothetical protein|uniref:hypothetical protein n=1 Tax=Rhizorhabdus sp. TaxID=1968843 RepID=UPI00198F9E66|nr:hypothetical protein [Rhizorhabdus sp.]MBD3762951.1 hypothetical protein [Rhizorhabdus sp.]MCZ4342921.1 hypothetical protein [Sphingomonadaceae bacterium G21617-S1]
MTTRVNWEASAWFCVFAGQSRPAPWNGQEITLLIGQMLQNSIDAGRHMIHPEPEYK